MPWVTTADDLTQPVQVRDRTFEYYDTEVGPDGRLFIYREVLKPEK
jgi:hypothetical protein